MLESKGLLPRKLPSRHNVAARAATVTIGYNKRENAADSEALNAELNLATLHYRY
jgi:hypothetical protein